MTAGRLLFTIPLVFGLVRPAVGADPVTFAELGDSITKGVRPGDLVGNAHQVQAEEGDPSQCHQDVLVVAALVFRDGERG